MPMGFCLIIIMLTSGKRNSLAVVMLLQHEEERHHNQDQIMIRSDNRCLPLMSPVAGASQWGTSSRAHCHRQHAC
jgi:hypothetical protein